MEKVDRALADAQHDRQLHRRAVHLAAFVCAAGPDPDRCELARYYLYDDQFTETVKQRYDANIKFLIGVASGDVKLGVDANRVSTGRRRRRRAVHRRPHLGSPFLGRVSLMVQATIRYEGSADWMPRCLAWPRWRSPRPIFRRSPTTANPRPACALSASGPDGSAWKPSRRVQKSGGQTLVNSRRCFAASPTSMATLAAWGSNVAYAASTSGRRDQSRPYSPASACAPMPAATWRTSLAIAIWRCSPATATSGSHELARGSCLQDPHARAAVLGVNREDMWAMGRLTVQTIQRPRRWRCSVSMNSPSCGLKARPGIQKTRARWAACPPCLMTPSCCSATWWTLLPVRDRRGVPDRRRHGRTGIHRRDRRAQRGGNTQARLGDGHPSARISF